MLRKAVKNIFNYANSIIFICLVPSSIGGWQLTYYQNEIPLSKTKVHVLYSLYNFNDLLINISINVNFDFLSIKSRKLVEY